jgi:hypothetical protein
MKTAAEGNFRRDFCKPGAFFLLRFLREEQEIALRGFFHYFLS